MPDYDSVQESETDIDCLIALLAKTHEELTSFIRVRFSDTPLDTEIMSIIKPEKLAIAIADYRIGRSLSCRTGGVHPHGNRSVMGLLRIDLRRRVKITKIANRDHTDGSSGPSVFSYINEYMIF